jgi:hypothetical protein
MEVCDHVRSSMVIGNDNAGSLVYVSWVAFGVWVGWCGRRNLNHCFDRGGSVARNNNADGIQGFTSTLWLLEGALPIGGGSSGGF